MKSIVLLLVLSLLSFACTKVETQNIPYNDISFYQDVSDSRFARGNISSAVVLIGNGNSFGTGSFVSNDGVLITNNHVLGHRDCFIEGCYINLYFDYQKGRVVSGRRVYAKPLHGSSRADISVFQIYTTEEDDEGVALKTDNKLITNNFLSISKDDPRDFVGQTLYTIGHPQVALKKVTELEVLSTDGHDFRIKGAVISGQSGSPVVTESGVVVGLVKTSTISFTGLSNNGLNVSGGVVAIKELLPFFEQSLSSFSVIDESQLQVSEFASMEDPFVKENWDDYYFMFQAARVPVGGESLTSEASDVVSTLEARCEVYVNSVADGVVSFSEFTQDISSRSCSQLLSLNRCKEEDLSGLGILPPSREPLSDRHFCATEEQELKWSGWMMTIFDAEAEYNGKVYTSYLRRAVQLDDSLDYDQLYFNKLDQVQPTLNFDLLQSVFDRKLRAEDELSYAGIDLVTYFENYKSQPEYYLYASSIVAVIEALAERGLTQRNPLQVIRELYNDPNLSLADRWRMEADLYSYGQF